MARPPKAPSQSSSPAAPAPAPIAPLARRHHYSHPHAHSHQRRQRSHPSSPLAPAAPSSVPSAPSAPSTAPSAASAPASTRRRHTNSKLGCANCKRKKIRCDEQLPQCGKCARGKREVCSYLSLSSAEIQRIRLTHSLRNSQNKLLELEYRLPASASAPAPSSLSSRSGAPSAAPSASGAPWPAATAGAGAGAALEFVHEGTDLPPLPRWRYGELRFVAVGEGDFDWDSASSASVAPAPAPPRPHMSASMPASMASMATAPAPRPPLASVSSSPPASIAGAITTPPAPSAPFAIAPSARPAPRTLPVPGLSFVPTPIPAGLPVQQVAKLAMDQTRIVAREFQRPPPPQYPHYNAVAGQMPSPAPSVQLRNILPGGYYQPCRFPRLKRKLRSNPEKHGHRQHGKGPCSISCSHFRVGKFSLLEHIGTMLEATKQPVGGELAWGCLIYIGASAVSNTLRKKSVYHPQFSANIDYVALSQALGNRARRLGESIRRQFTTHIQLLVSTWHEFADIGYLEQTMMVLGFCMLLVVLAADISFDEYYQVSERWAVMIREVGKFAEVLDRNLKEGDERSIAGYSVHQIGHNISGSRVPPYPPQFVSELVDNFQRLEPMFIIPLGRFSSCSAQYTELQYEYTQLLQYLRDLLTVVTTSKQRKESVTVYPFEDIWRLLKSWHRKFPAGALAYNPKREPQDTDEQRFIADIKATLYMYYQATSVALEALFPCTKYLCTTQFMAPSQEFFRNKQAMTPRDTPFHAHGGPRAAQSLQKHNYYAMRLYTFFKHRYLLYHQYIQWTQPYPESLRRQRYKSRAITNAHEVPIVSFNNTLIRPEHYPTKEKHTPVTEHDSFLTRTDETMDNHMYSRNIERLNLFNSNVQFDYGTMMLLSDYRYDDSQLHFHHNELTVAGLVEFYEDRVLLLRDAMGWSKASP